MIYISLVWHTTSQIHLWVYPKGVPGMEHDQKFSAKIFNKLKRMGNKCYLKQLYFSKTFVWKSFKCKAAPFYPSLLLLGAPNPLSSSYCFIIMTIIISCSVLLFSNKMFRMARVTVSWIIQNHHFLNCHFCFWDGLPMKPVHWLSEQNMLERGLWLWVCIFFWVMLLKSKNKNKN